MGMRHFLEQFGDTLKLPWTKLVAPELTPSSKTEWCEGTEAQADGRSVKELERKRDEFLVALLDLKSRLAESTSQP